MKTKRHLLYGAFCGLVLLTFCSLGHAAADLWIRDDINDVGNEPNNDSPLLYTSDDIWVRRLPDPNYDPHPFPIGSPTWSPLPHEGPCYRDPKTSSPNYIYVRVRNRGSSPSSGTETLHVYWAKASTGLNWPGDWNDHLDNPCGGTPRLYGYEITKARKNGATASVSEKADYVAAIQTIDTASFQFPDGMTYFDKQNFVHSTLFGSGIHNSLRFLPWHREFMNRYEALLKEINPALTLLYWDWTTDPSPAIVGAGYMGVASGVVGAPFSTFGISRAKSGSAPGVFAGGLALGYQTGTLIPSANYSTLWSNIEVPTHNSAHNYMGGTMASGNAARDPMFFMLHANCDRIWAMWQRRNSASVDPWTPGQAYDASQAASAITSDLRPWDGTDLFSPWQNSTPGDPNGYVIHKNPTHHSIVYPPTYDDVLLKIPVLGSNEACIIEIPFYPPPALECGSFPDPQHLCLLARIEPMPAPLETANLWQNVKDHNNIAWRNVTLSDCNVGPFFIVLPGRIGAAGELIRNFRDQPAVLTLRFLEAQAGFRSLFNYGHVRLRLEQNLYDAWVKGGHQGQGIEAAGQNEILVLSPGATLAGLALDKRELGHMDLALELNKNYPEPSGDIYHLDVLQYDDQSPTGVQIPVGGQRYDLDFNLLKIIPKGSDWKFIDGGEIPAADWASITYDDSKWRMGSAPFGYGHTDVATGLRGTNGQPPTAYFRKMFYVPDPSFFHNLALNLILDDGLVIYLNGKEIARLNMPTGAITPGTSALTPISGAAARACRSININDALSLLEVGQNVLTAELHAARNANLIDLTYDLELAGNVPSTPYQPPEVVITRPLNGALFRAGADVQISADVFDPDGDLSEVRFYTDGRLSNRQVQPPFTGAFTSPSLGRHRVSVEAQDTFGHLTRMESTFAVVSNLVPRVEIMSPIGQHFPAGSRVMVIADASDPDGKVRQVALYVRKHLRYDTPPILIGVPTAAPYTGIASNLDAGHYIAYAVATDDESALGYSLTGHFIIDPPAGTPDMAIHLQNLGGPRVLTIEWDKPGSVLQHASKVNGPWQSYSDADSPYPVEPRTSEFYRLLLAPAGSGQ
jgi:hypothetical protein